MFSDYILNTGNLFASKTPAILQSNRTKILQFYHLVQCEYVMAHLHRRNKRKIDMGQFLKQSAYYSLGGITSLLKIVINAIKIKLPPLGV
jgi:hypothetical protein